MIDGMGDKAAAKATMEKAGVPTIPGSNGLIKDFNEIVKNCIRNRISYYVKSNSRRRRKRNEISMGF